MVADHHYHPPKKSKKAKKGKKIAQQVEPRSYALFITSMVLVLVSVFTWLMVLTAALVADSNTHTDSYSEQWPAGNYTYMRLLLRGTFLLTRVVSRCFQLTPCMADRVGFCRLGVEAKASVGDMQETRRQRVLTVAGVWFVPLFQRCSCSLLFLLAILVTATLKNPVDI